MKVLQIANGYYNAPLYAALFSALEGTGTENLIFVPVRNGTQVTRGSSALTGSSSNIIVSPCFSQTDRLMYYTKQKKIITRIKALSGLKDIQVIHAHTLFSSGFAAMKLKQITGKPYIVAVRNVDVNVFFKRMKHLGNTGVKILKDASKIIFLSPAYKRKVLNDFVPLQYADALKKKSIVIPNGISSLFLEEKGLPKKLDGEKIRILYVGEINRNKNLSEIIEAAKMLNGRKYTVSVECVGDVTEKSCRPLLDDPLVRHYPGCTQKELLHHYRNADIFAMPSHTETFGLVYAEAMSQGLPVLYTKGQGFDGHFKDGEVGYSVSDRDAADLAGKIRLVTDHYEEISKRCIDKADKFDWRKIAEKYHDIYTGVAMSN